MPKAIQYVVVVQFSTQLFQQYEVMLKGIAEVVPFLRPDVKLDPDHLPTNATLERRHAYVRDQDTVVTAFLMREKLLQHIDREERPIGRCQYIKSKACVHWNHLKGIAGHTQHTRDGAEDFCTASQVGWI